MKWAVWLGRGAAYHPSTPWENTASTEWLFQEHVGSEKVKTKSEAKGDMERKLEEQKGRALSLYGDFFSSPKREIRRSPSSEGGGFETWVLGLGHYL